MKEAFCMKRIAALIITFITLLTVTSCDYNETPSPTVAPTLITTPTPVVEPTPTVPVRSVHPVNQETAKRTAYVSHTKVLCFFSRF